MARKARCTPRRIKILVLVGKGYNNEQIAREMDMSIDNVKLQISRIINFFNVRKRGEAVEAAMERGYIYPFQLENRKEGCK